MAETTVNVREVVAVRIIPLDEAFIRNRLDEFVALDAPGINWDAERFLNDRPGKWQLSLAAYDDATLVGVMMMSHRQPGRPHVHLLLVRKEWRSRRIGSALLREHARRSGDEVITLKVARENSDGIRFYIREGFRTTTRTGDYLWMAARREDLRE